MFRNLLLAALAGTALLVTAPAQAQTTLRFGHALAPSHSVMKHGVDHWMNCVAERAADHVVIDHYPSGQLTNFSNSLDALNDGLVDVSLVAVAYSTSKLPLNGLALLPDTGDNARQMVAAYRRMMEAGPLAEEYAQNRIKPIFANMFPPYQLISRKAAFEGADSLHGTLIRSAGGVMSNLISSLGASPAEIPSADLYVALERGTVDAAMIGLSSIRSYSLFEVGKFVSANASFGSGTTVIAVSNTAWDSLPAEAQEALASCGAEAEGKLAEALDNETDELIADFRSQGVEVYEFDDATLEAFAGIGQQVAQEYVDRLEARDLPAAAAYQAYRNAIAEVRAGR